MISEINNKMKTKTIITPLFLNMARNKINTIVKKTYFNFRQKKRKF